MNVTDPISLAAGHMKRVLFRSFDLGSWFAFGLIFFLDQLLEGGSSSFNFPGGFGAPPTPPSGGAAGGAPAPFTLPMNEWLTSGRAWMTAHASEIILYGSIFLIVSILFGLLFLWLSCRGQMMAVHAVARAEGRVTEAWRATREAGWALFRFRLVYGVLSLVVWIPLAVFLVLRLIAMAESPAPTDLKSIFLAIVPFVILGTLIALVFALVECFLRGFVVPMMLHFRIGALEAWRKFFGIASQNPLQMAGYVVIRIGLSIAVAILRSMGTLLTCCIGGLPVLHQTLLAPVFVFDRAYSLFVLASIGPEYQMISPEPPASTWGNPYPYPSPNNAPPGGNIPPDAGPNAGGGGGNPYGGGPYWPT